MNAKPTQGEFNNRALLALVIAATAIGPLSMNLLVPSMPGLQRAFNVDYGTAQLTLSGYLFALAGAQLIHGPLSDRFGRRPVLLCGLVINLMGSTICFFAPSIYVLIFGRIIQAVGGCVGMVVGRAIVRDRFDRTRTAAMLSYVTMVMVVAPMLAPAIGGFLDVWLGWRTSFLFVMTASSIVLVATALWLRETIAERTPNVAITGVLLDFGRLLGERRFCGYAFQVACTGVVFLSFVVAAPWVTVEILGRSPSDYGLYFMPVAGVYMVSNFVSGTITPRFGIERMIAMGTSIALCGGIIVVAAQLLGHLSMLTVFAPMVLIAAGHGFCVPNGLAGAVSVNPRIAGSAAGLSGFLQIFVGACISVVVGNLMADNAVPLAAAMLLGTVGSVAAHVFGVLMAKEPSGGPD
ncbi:MAG: multidrug effflux MFS transporter [Rhodospirillales bacterium]|nr:multidrug effflux MFS transporter [Rhodospirillales bacterium]